MQDSITITLRLVLNTNMSLSNCGVSTSEVAMHRRCNVEALLSRVSAAVLSCSIFQCCSSVVSLLDIQCTWSMEMEWGRTIGTCVACGGSKGVWYEWSAEPAMLAATYHPMCIHTIQTKLDIGVGIDVFECQQPSLPTSSVSVTRVWSHCWTNFLDEGDGLGQNIGTRGGITVCGMSDPLSWPCQPQHTHGPTYVHTIQELTGVGIAHACPIMHVNFAVPVLWTLPYGRQNRWFQWCPPYRGLSNPVWYVLP